MRSELRPTRKERVVGFTPSRIGLVRTGRGFSCWDAVSDFEILGVLTRHKSAFSSSVTESLRDLATSPLLEHEDDRAPSCVVEDLAVVLLGLG